MHAAVLAVPEVPLRVAFPAMAGLQLVPLVQRAAHRRRRVPNGATFETLAILSYRSPFACGTKTPRARPSVSSFFADHLMTYPFRVYAVYAISSLDTGSPLRHRTCNAVGTPKGVAGLAPRPFTLGEETGSHHMVVSPISPRRRSRSGHTML